MNHHEPTRARRRVMATLAASAIAMLFSVGAAAEDAYPSKPIHMLLGFAPGGPTDIVARILGQKISDRLGQPIVVENRPGAGGNIAADQTAKAPADGYTIFYNTSSIVIAPWVYNKVNFDPVKDFAPVALTADMPLVLLVGSRIDSKTVADFVKLVQSRPDTFTYGSSGVGAIEHLTSAQFVSAYQLHVSHIPYKGTAPALIDLIAGQTGFMMTTMNTAVPYVRDGKLRALGVTSKERSKAMPEVPTVAEAMNSSFQSSAWQGIVVPAGTPRPIIDKLNGVINQVLKDPEVVNQLAAQGVSTLGGTSEQYAKFIASELTHWEGVVKQSGAKAE
jgi:tripartite-type tricarboxylate transporter receptor subunit TctC